MQHERKACSAYADKYARNYYAWTHRAALLPLLLSSPGLRDEELASLQRWSRSHIADASALHYRSLVVEPHPPASRIDDEVKLLTELITFYEGHEALFCYLRWLLSSSTTPPHAPALALLLRLCQRDVTHQKQRQLALRLLAWCLTFIVRGFNSLIFLLLLLLVFFCPPHCYAAVIGS